MISEIPFLKTFFYNVFIYFLYRFYRHFFRIVVYCKIKVINAGWWYNLDDMVPISMIPKYHRQYDETNFVHHTVCRIIHEVSRTICIQIRLNKWKMVA